MLMLSLELAMKGFLLWLAVVTLTEALVGGPSTGLVATVETRPDPPAPVAAAPRPRERLARSEARAPQTAGVTTTRRATPPQIAKVAPAAARDDLPEPLGVQKLGEHDYRIDRAKLEALLDRPDAMSGARSVPVFRGGRYAGVRMHSLRPGTAFQALGLRTGDILRAVNGRNLDSPNRALELFQQLRQAPSIDLTVERGGETVVMRYSFS